MPLFQGFFDGYENPNEKKFMLSFRTSTLEGARSAFESECPDTHKLSAIAEQSGAGRLIFRLGNHLIQLLMRFI